MLIQQSRRLVPKRTSQNLQKPHPHNKDHSPHVSKTGPSQITVGSVFKNWFLRLSLMKVASFISGSALLQFLKTTSSSHLRLILVSDLAAVSEYFSYKCLYQLIRVNQ